MRIKIVAFLCTLAITLNILGPSASAAPKPLTIPFEKYELPNGLDVILHENHSIPIVAVNVWYHVGSKNERLGKTGFAHLFEHMMFQGSEHHDKEYFEPLEKLGASVNGSTSSDRTNYFEVLPSNNLELALWLESDRMGYLLPAMTQEKLNNQRDVVKNEKRQAIDNQPYGKADEILASTLYPPHHPYSWDTIGSMEDLDAASLENVSQFFKTYYTPNNATLVIAGDFDPATVKLLVQKYFGTLPQGSNIDRLTTWTPALDAEIRKIAFDYVSLPRLYMTWHTPGYFKPGDAELDLLAEILAGGKTSRLYKTLVYDKQIAQDVTVYQASAELGSVFHIIVTAKPGHTLEEIEPVIDAELDKIRKNGITKAELQMGQASWEARFVRSLQEVGGIADKLNEYNYYLGSPDKFVWDQARYAKATTASVLSYVKKYLDPAKRVVLSILPQDEFAADADTLDRSVQPDAASEPSFTPPTIERTTLTNSIELLLVEDHRLPLVQADLVLKSGWAADAPDKPGVAALTSELLNEGTKTKSALQISDAARRLGANLGTGSYFDGSVVSLNVLKKNFDPALTLMADVVMNPAFPQDELDRQKALYLGRIEQEERHPVRPAIKAFQKLIYGEGHPYAQPYTGSGTLESITRIAKSDLTAFYKAHYLPNNATIVIAGDMTLADAKAKFEKAFKGWKKGVLQEKKVPMPAAPAKTALYLIDKPDAPQSVIIAGHLGIARNDTDYLTTQVMNKAFGAQFTSRLNLNLREDKGYTYGAGSQFTENKGVGTFYAYAAVEASTTDESIKEIVKEMKELLAARPLTETEITDSKNNLIRSFPQAFQTYEGITGLLSNQVIFGLPANNWYTYVSRANAITAESATKSARDHLNPDALVIVVVGDKKTIEPGIRALNLGQINYLNP